MRHSFIDAQFQALGIHQDQAHLAGRGLVQNRHDHGIEGHALAGAGGASDQHVRHGRQIGGDDAAIDVLAHGQGEVGFGVDELRRLHYLAQPNGLPLVIRHLNAHGRFARHALNQNALGAHGQA